MVSVNVISLFQPPNINFLGHPIENMLFGIPGSRSSLAPAFGPGRDPGDPGSNPMSGSLHLSLIHISEPTRPY